MLGGYNTALIERLRGKLTSPNAREFDENRMAISLEGARQGVEDYAFYAIPDAGVRFLEMFGISVNPSASRNHSHAACKTLENYVRLNVLCPLLKGTKYDIVGTKPHKFQIYLNKAPPAAGWNPKLINVCVVGKDRDRFGPCGPGPLPATEADVIVTEDSLHNWHPHDLLDYFERSQQLISLYATVWAPMAHMLGVREWTDGAGHWKQTNSNTVRFNPNGRWNEGYDQPIRGHDGKQRLPFWFVQYWRYRNAGLSITAHIVGSMGNFVTIKFTRGEPMCPPSDYLHSPQETIIPGHQGWLRYTPPVIVPTPALSTVLSFVRNNNVKNPKAIAGRLSRFCTNNQDVLMPPGIIDALVDHGYYLSTIMEHRPGPTYLPTYELHHLMTRNPLARFVRGWFGLAHQLVYASWQADQSYAEVHLPVLKHTFDLTANDSLSPIMSGEFVEPDTDSILSTLRAVLLAPKESHTGAYNGTLATAPDLSTWLNGSGGIKARAGDIKKTLTYKFMPYLALFTYCFLLLSIIRSAPTYTVSIKGPTYSEPANITLLNPTIESLCLPFQRDILLIKDKTCRRANRATWYLNTFAEDTAPEEPELAAICYRHQRQVARITQTACEEAAERLLDEPCYQFQEGKSWADKLFPDREAQAVDPKTCLITHRALVPWRVKRNTLPWFSPEKLIMRTFDVVHWYLAPIASLLAHASLPMWLATPTLAVTMQFPSLIILPAVTLAWQHHAKLGLLAPFAWLGLLIAAVAHYTLGRTLLEANTASIRLYSAKTIRQRAVLPLYKLCPKLIQVDFQVHQLFHPAGLARSSPQDPNLNITESLPQPSKENTTPPAETTNSRFPDGGTMKHPSKKPDQAHNYQHNCEMSLLPVANMRGSVYCGKREAAVHFSGDVDLALILELTVLNKPCRVTFFPYASDPTPSSFTTASRIPGFNAMLQDGVLSTCISKLNQINSSEVRLNSEGALKAQDYGWSAAFHNDELGTTYVKPYLAVNPHHDLASDDVLNFLEINHFSQQLVVIRLGTEVHPAQLTAFGSEWLRTPDPTLKGVYWLIGTEADDLTDSATTSEGNDAPEPMWRMMIPPVCHMGCLDHNSLTGLDATESHRKLRRCSVCKKGAYMLTVCNHSPKSGNCPESDQIMCHLCVGQETFSPSGPFEEHLARGQITIEMGNQQATLNAEIPSRSPTPTASTVSSTAPTHAECTDNTCREHDRSRKPGSQFKWSYCSHHVKFWRRKRCPTQCDLDHIHSSEDSTACHLCEHEDLLLGQGALPSLPTNNTCLIDAIADSTQTQRDTVWAAFNVVLGDQAAAYSKQAFPLSFRHLNDYALLVKATFIVRHDNGVTKAGNQGAVYQLRHSSSGPNTGHWSAEGAPTINGTINPVYSAATVGPNSTLDEKLRALLGGYTPDILYTKNHANCFYDSITEQRYEGWLGSTQGRAYVKEHMQPMISPPSKDRHVATGGVLGRPGAGKTNNFMLIIADHLAHTKFRPDVTVLIRSASGRKDIKQRLNIPKGKGNLIKTYEVAFAEVMAPIVLLDDVGAFPPGYVDALVLCNPQIKLVLFTGGPGQHSSRADAPKGTGRWCPTALRKLSSAACCYLTDVRRTSLLTSQALGWPTSNKTVGGIHFSNPPQGCATIDDNSRSGAGSRAVKHVTHTLTECQGLTFPEPYGIILSPSALNLVDDEFMYTALSRGQDSVHVIEINGNLDRLANSASSILRALVAYKNGDPSALRIAVRDHEIRNLPQHLADPIKQPATYMSDVSPLLHPNIAGTGTAHLLSGSLVNGVLGMNLPENINVGEMTYTAAPNYSYETRLNAVDVVPHYAAQYDDPILSEEDFLGRFITKPTHDDLTYCKADTSSFTSFESLYAGPIAALLTETEQLEQVCINLWGDFPVEGREQLVNGQYTEQINTESYAKSLFPKHNPNDAATMEWSLIKRIRKPRLTPEGCFQSAYHLMAAYDMVYQPIMPGFDADMWDTCEQLSEGTYLAKGIKRLQNICERSDPSAIRQTIAELFMKSQSVTKIDSLLGKAKAAQLIYSFCTWHLAHMGPAQHYMYAAWRSSLPEHILLLNGLTHDDYAAWVDKHWDFKEPCFTSDYTAFDASQREWALALDVQFMRRCHVPQKLIDEYLGWAVELETYLGALGVLIFSGFKFTWMFNTFNSMCYNALKYELPPQANANSPFPFGNHTPPTELTKFQPISLPGAHTAMTFSGDDTGLNLNPSIRPAFTRLGIGIELTCKEALSKYLMFCGQCSVPGSTFANPELMTARIIYRLAHDSLDSCLLSYAELAGQGIRAAIDSQEYLTETELSCVNFNYSLLKIALERKSLPLVGTHFIKLMKHVYRLL